MLTFPLNLFAFPDDNCTRTMFTNADNQMIFVIFLFCKVISFKLLDQYPSAAECWFSGGNDENPIFGAFVKKGLLSFLSGPHCCILLSTPLYIWYICVTMLSLFYSRF